MQLLQLGEEDTLLFNSQVNRTLYALYRDNTEMFTVMWEQQGTGFWLKYCISLRSVLQKQGFYVQLSAFDLTHLEEFFINLVNLLTGTSAGAVHTYVKDVVSVCRFHQLLSNIPVNASIPRQTPSFIRLFGSPFVAGNTTKMFGTLPLHLRAVGSLLRLLERWLVVRAVSTSDKALWHVPESWCHGNQLLASNFENFLKRTWDTQLLSLLGVSSRDISWWNSLPEDNSITKVQEHHGELRHIIAALSKSIDIPLSECIGIMREEIFYHHIVTSCPRGKFRILNTDTVTLMFIRALCCGLYLVENMTAFHPYSQVIISFSNAAFNHAFWYEGKGMQTQLRNLEEEHCSQCPVVILHAAEVNFLFHVISSHLIHARLAIDLNSKFYDTLYGGITWMSRVTLTRLPWNIPLFTNWLEVLLIQIYKFERFFIPLCHFPLRKNIISLVECMYRKVAEAEFLVKACIIIADGIRRRQTQEASRCHGPRMLLYTVIPRLSHMMQFLQTDAYTVLEVILNAGWDKEEREDGESCALMNDRIKVDLATWNSVPDINEFYSKNFRNINYWISDAKWPDVGGGEEFYTEAYEMLKNYELGCKTRVEMKDPYNFSLFMECAKSRCLNLTGERNDPVRHLIVFGGLTIGLLEDDGWVSPLAANEFITPICLPADIYVLNGDQKKDLDQFVKLAAVYYVAACLLGDTWQCKIAGQNALAQLQRSEAYAVMADTGARLCALTQSSTGIAGCPPARYFQDAAAEIQNCSKDIHLSTEEAVLLLECFEKEASKKTDVNTDDALTVVKVPLSVEEMRAPSVGINWLKYLENKRIQLLQLVSVEHFRVTQSYEKSDCALQVELFPLHDVLEHRLVEEMAAMQKCLELEGLYYGPAYGLCRLLAHRFTWIQKSFIKWKKRKHELQGPLLPLDTKDLHFMAVHIHFRMLAARIPLQALFLTYISEFQTTHPISEMTTAMFCSWTDTVRVWCVQDEWNSLGNCLREYSQTLKEMGCRYIEQMLVHCMEVWVVAPFCADPEASVEFGSIEHGQQIVTTFTQLFLMCGFAILVQKPGIVWDITCKVDGKLVLVTTILRQVEVDINCIQSWPKARQLLKKELRSVWSSLLEMRKAVHMPAHDVQFPGWFGNSSHIWRNFFIVFVSSKYRNILQKVAFSEFINTKDPESDDASSTKLQNEHINEAKKSKAGNKVLSSVHGPEEPPAPILTARDVHKNHNTASKNNVAEKMVNSCDISENKSLKNVQAKENQNQSKQCPSDKSSKQSTSSGNETPSNHKMCTYCKSVESERRMYKKCSLCKKEKWHHPRYYCSKECQVKDWKAKHNMEHTCAEVLE